MKSSQKGLSLIESAMVLALAAVVISGTVYYYSAAAEEKINQDTVALVETIVSKVNALYANQSSTGDLSTKMIARQIPGAKLTTLPMQENIAILVPGSTGLLSVQGIDSKYLKGHYKEYIIDYSDNDDSASKKLIYNRCMMLTGGQFGSSFLGYMNSYQSTSLSTDLSVTARRSFCEKQKAGHTGSNIQLHFRA